MTGGRWKTSQWDPLAKAKRKTLGNSTEFITRLVFSFDPAKKLLCFFFVTRREKEKETNVTRIVETSKHYMNIVISVINQSRSLSAFCINGWHERRFLKERSNNYFPPSRMRSLFVMSVIVLAEYLSPHLVQTQSVLRSIQAPLFFLIGNF